MPIPVTVPKATITMEEANILAWRKQPGDLVEKDEILFEMETDKVIVEIPAPASGVLLRIDVREGLARVEQPVCWIGMPGEELPSLNVATPAVRPENPPATTSAPPAECFAPGVSVSPAARRLARELSVDLSQVRGTGPGGRVTESDVEEASGRR